MFTVKWLRIPLEKKEKLWEHLSHLISSTEGIDSNKTVRKDEKLIFSDGWNF